MKKKYSIIFLTTIVLWTSCSSSEMAVRPTLKGNYSQKPFQVSTKTNKDEVWPAGKGCSQSTILTRSFKSSPKPRAKL